MKRKEIISKMLVGLMTTAMITTGAVPMLSYAQTTEAVATADTKEDAEKFFEDTFGANGSEYLFRGVEYGVKREENGYKYTVPRLTPSGYSFPSLITNVNQGQK